MPLGYTAVRPYMHALTCSQLQCTHCPASSVHLGLFGLGKRLKSILECLVI